MPTLSAPIRLRAEYSVPNFAVAPLLSRSCLALLSLLPRSSLAVAAAVEIGVAAGLQERASPGWAYIVMAYIWSEPRQAGPT